MKYATMLELNPLCNIIIIVSNCLSTNLLMLEMGFTCMGVAVEGFWNQQKGISVLTFY